MLVCACLACGGNSPGEGRNSGPPDPTTPSATHTTPSTTPTAHPTTTTTTTASVTPTPSTTSDPTTPDPPEFVAPPVVLRPDLEELHLVRWVELKTDRDTTVEFSWTDGDQVREHHVSHPATAHRAPLLGLHPGRAYTLTVSVTDEHGLSSHSEPVLFETAEVPDGFPRIGVLSHDPAATEPGLTLLDVRSADQDYLLILDETLQVTWYMQVAEAGDAGFTERGTLLADVDNRVLEMDLMGGPAGTWPDLFVHHEVHPRADGGVLTLSNASASVDEYPSSYDAPWDFRRAQIQVTTVLRFEADGTPLEPVPLDALLDTRRIGFNGLDVSPGGYEWTHGNAVVPDPHKGGMLVSLRHQDAVVKLSDAGELEWILGNPMAWREAHQPFLFTPEGERFRWFYHQHAAELMAPDTVLLFDNGNDQHTPYEPDPGLEEVSRVVAYRLDTDAMTVEQLWQYADPPGGPLHCKIFGDADMQPETGHVLAVFGGLKGDFGASNVERGWGADTARILEFAPDTGEPPVLDVRIYALIDEVPGGFKTYRAERTAQLYTHWSRSAP
jgi:arylsulfate sulfotransferase